MRSLLSLFFSISAVLAANIETLLLAGPPSVPPGASHTLHPSLASFSIETAFLTIFLGNTSQPNDLSAKLFKNLHDRSSFEVRIGGITADSTYWDSSLETATYNFIDENGALQNTTISPAFFDAIKELLPEGVAITMNLDLQDLNYTGALEVANASRIGLGEQLVAFEIGNEPDHYSPLLSAMNYSEIWSTWSKNITSTLSLPPPIFQIGATAEDPLWPYDSPGASDQLDCVSALTAGGNRYNTTKLCSEHTYQYSVCDPVRTAVATLPNLVNHTRLAMYLDLWIPRINTVRDTLGDHTFLIGEYSSVSCSGKDNVSNTFGQALWLLDTTFYAASLNVSRLYSHQGGPLALQSSTQLNHGGLSFYDMWWPVDNLNGPTQVFPSYGAYLLITESLANSTSLRISNIYPGKQSNSSTVTPAMGDSSFGQVVAYGFWDEAGDLGLDHPAKLALLNLEIFNATQNEADRPSVEFDVNAYLKPGMEVRIKRLQAPGADVKGANVTLWAGQSYETGDASGELIEEWLDSSGKITLMASEAALLEVI